MRQKKLKLISRNNEYFVWEPETSDIYNINSQIFKALSSEGGFINIPPSIPDDQKQLLNNLLSYSKLPVVTTSENVKNMILHVTWKCNLSCKYCYIDIEGIQKDEMSLENIVSAINQFSEKGGLSIDISGGEPLLRADLAKIVKAAYDNVLRVKLVTNGTLLNDEKINEIKKYVHQISVSIDGMKEIHDSQRGNGTFKKMESTLQLLYNHSVPIGVTTVINNQNMAQLNDLYNYLLSYNVEQWNLTLVRSTDRTKKTKIIKNESKQVYVDNFIKRIAPNNRMEVLVDESLLSPNLHKILTKDDCRQDYARWHNTISILPNGDCIACVFFPEIIYGNVVKEDFSTIYNSQIRKQALALKKPCNKCLSIQYGLKN